MGDLSNVQWTAKVGGPFDLAVSAIAIHNLRDHGLIAACYRVVHSVLKPGAMFLDSDLVSFSGGLDAHLEWMRQAGFSRVECMLYREPLAQLAATAEQAVEKAASSACASGNGNEVVFCR